MHHSLVIEPKEAGEFKKIAGDCSCGGWFEILVEIFREDIKIATDDKYDYFQPIHKARAFAKTSFRELECPAIGFGLRRFERDLGVS